MRRRRAFGPALVSLALLAGCAIPGADDGPSPGGSDGPASTEGATMPTDIPSWLLECGADDKQRDETLQLADLDLTQATWSMPTGYAEGSGYYEDNPVETLYSDWVAEPTDPPLPLLNVLSLVIYTGVDWGDLADGCGRVPLAAVEEKLARYRNQIGAVPLSEAEMTTVAGRPAIHQDLSLATYDYTGWWLFSEDQLLHVYCQWTSDSFRDQIVSGCDSLAASVTVPDA